MRLLVYATGQYSRYPTLPERLAVRDYRDDRTRLNSIHNTTQHHRYLLRNVIEGSILVCLKSKTSQCHAASRNFPAQRRTHRLGTQVDTSGVVGLVRFQVDSCLSTNQHSGFASISPFTQHIPAPGEVVLTPYLSVILRLRLIASRDLDR
jgi:hypothetical protein